MTALTAFVAAELERPVPAEITEAAQVIAAQLGGLAVLFYGSVLRTSDLDGVIDLYILTDGCAHRGLRGAASRRLWPDVSYHEVAVRGRTIRAKVATMPLSTFRAAAEGQSLDTTIWARFVQPCALVWTQDAALVPQITDAVAAAAVTASRFAAALGPERGSASAFWKALFAETYRTEFRVEKPGREDQIIAYDRARFNRLLPLAWQAGDIAFGRSGDMLAPMLDPARRRRLLQAWRSRRRMGRPLNFARLTKAAFTFDGAARYALWKIERHTGLHVPLTPWRERHPILAAPGVLWRVWRTGQQR